MCCTSWSVLEAAAAAAVAAHGLLVDSGPLPARCDRFFFISQCCCVHSAWFIFPHAMFENNDFIWKFKNGSYQNGLNLLFGKSKIFKFEFGSNFTIVFKIVKVENLRMTTQTLSFSNSLFMISQLKSII